MDKNIICVYQDCPMCGARGQRLKKFIASEGLNVQKISFASNQGKDLCHKAVFEHGIKSMPFFTDGDRFSNSIKDFVQKCEKPKKIVKKSTKKPRKSVKKKKGVSDGVDS